MATIDWGDDVVVTPANDELFRRAADAEDGLSVSAGARMAHVQLSLEAGRAIQVDLTGVPADRRAQLVAAIRGLVSQANEAAIVSPSTASSANQP